jgi:hypothetical protein
MKSNSHSMHLLATLFSSCALLTACGGGSSAGGSTPDATAAVVDPNAPKASAEALRYDTVPPTVTLWAPSTASTYTTSDAAIVLGGTARDNRTVVRVTWINMVNGAIYVCGEALQGGTTSSISWSQPSVALAVGVNVITVYVYDEAGNRGQTTITVTRTSGATPAPAPTPAPTPAPAPAPAPAPTPAPAPAPTPAPAPAPTPAPAPAPTPAPAPAPAPTPAPAPAPAPATRSFTVSWKAPTLNADGTTVSDLAGYHIYYGTASGSYTQTVTVSSPTTTSYTLANLPLGTYYVTVSAFDASNLESQRSAEVSKTLQ